MLNATSESKTNSVTVVGKYVQCYLRIVFLHLLKYSTPVIDHKLYVVSSQTVISPWHVVLLTVSALKMQGILFLSHASISMSCHRNYYIFHWIEMKVGVKLDNPVKICISFFVAVFQFF